MAQHETAPTDHEIRDRELFDGIAEQYCRKDLLPASRRARRQRLWQTLRVANVAPDAEVLEVGCGAGFSARYLQGRVGSYCGVDYSEKLIDYARAHNAVPGAEFVATNIKDFRPGRSFHLVFAIGLLHHLDDLGPVLEHLTHLLKPGGWLVANEPHPGNPLISFARKIRKRTDSDYSADQKELTGSEVRIAYEEAGLRSVRIAPQGLFSTPFAEVILRPQWLFVPLSAASCFADRIVERLPAALLKLLTWNLIVAGQKQTGEIPGPPS